MFHVLKIKLEFHVTIQTVHYVFLTIFADAAADTQSVHVVGKSCIYCRILDEAC